MSRPSSSTPNLLTMLAFTTTVDILDANGPNALSGWVLDGVDYTTKLAWFNVVTYRVMTSIPLPRGSAISLPSLYKDGIAKRNFFRREDGYLR
jgi:hypothetical protein